MNFKKVIESWAFPDRSTERTQMTLRIRYTDYARLHALKAAYPSRSVNEILTDIIQVALDELVDELPVYGADIEDVAIAHAEGNTFVEVGDPYRGPRIDYIMAYRNIISGRSVNDEGTTEEAQS